MLHVFINRIASPRPCAWRKWQHMASIVATCLTTTFLMLGLLKATDINAAPSAVTWPQIRFEILASGFDDPLDIVSANDGTNRLFVVEKGGKIRIIENGVRLDEEFLDIASEVYDCSECGLLGLAFPPDYAEKGYFFVNYTSDTNLVAPDPWDNENNNDQNIGDTVIARFHVSQNPNVADADSEEKILIINQPAGNHNGGHIVFGPDGYLYIGMGDGGGSNDEFENAQNPKSLLGKMLRIEVGETGTYTVPVDNPFVNDPSYRDEIWATGLRNPWRFNFDRTTNDLYITDVGQESREEVNYIAAADIGKGGMNFGWPIMEGNVCFPPSGAQDCDDTDLTNPVTDYNHALGDCSITGGYVFHSTLPLQEPIYLYSDFCTGRIRGTQPDGNKWESNVLADLNFQVSTFGEDENGRLYLASYNGTIYRVVEPAVFLPMLIK